MPVMAVNENNQQEPSVDYRSRPRWSAGKKMEAVLRLLRGGPLERLLRELGVEAHRLAAWRDDFLAAGKEALRAQRPDRSPDDRAWAAGRTQDRPADHGERDPAGGGRKKGATDPAGEAAEIAVDRKLPVAVVCRVLGAPRSTVYARRGRSGSGCRHDRDRPPRSATPTWWG